MVTYSETIVEDFDYVIVANNVLEIDKDRICSETNILSVYFYKRQLTF
jgi:hypothetical protein